MSKVTNFYTINMSFRKGNGEMDVFKSRQFKKKSHAVRAMHKMTKYGFHRNMNEEWVAQYSLVTYTRFGDVVDCEKYHKLHHGDMTITGKSIPIKHNIEMTMTDPAMHSPHSHSNTSSGVFSKYTLEEYGKGYLMCPPRGDVNWGMKYFYVDGGCGWWNDKQNGWFFRSKFLPFLLKNGVQTVITEPSTTMPSALYRKQVSNSTQTRRSKRLNGAKSYHEAKIRSVEKRKRFERLNRLADELVKKRRSKKSIVAPEYDSDEDSDYVPEAEVEEEDSEEYVPDEDTGLDFFNYTVRAYKRGFLLVPEEGDENWGEKYFHNGWWMPSQNAWFFRPKYYDFLIENGARSLDGAPETNEVDFDEVDFDELDNGILIAQSKTGNVRLIKYGRGVVLKVPKSHPKYGEPYYYDNSGVIVDPKGIFESNRGWWNKNAKGWFFRRNMISHLCSDEVHDVSPLCV